MCGRVSYNKSGLSGQEEVSNHSELPVNMLSRKIVADVCSHPGNKTKKQSRERFIV